MGEESVMDGNCWRCCVVLIALAASIAVLAYALSSSLSPQKEDPTTADNNNNGSRAVESLRFLAIVSRHGNRAPLVTFANNPYPLNDTKYWPYGAPHLTTYGRVQLYNLGVKIRSLYHGFLKSEYYSTDLYATSTILDRTLLSGEAFLSGLFPPTGFQIWNKDILWQPIALYSDSLDKTLLINSNCPRFGQIRSDGVADFLKIYGSNLSAVNIYLSKFAGQNISTTLDFFDVWEPLICASLEGYTLPEWTRKVFPDPMTYIAGKTLIANFISTHEATRLLIGQFFDQMIGVMKSKVNGTLTPDRQLYFYSGHDASLLALQAVLGIPQSALVDVVMPGSAMVYELHQDSDTKQYSVQVLYINANSSTLDPTPLDIPGCGTFCDFNQLVNITQNFTNVSFDEECKIK